MTDIAATDIAATDIAPTLEDILLNPSYGPKIIAPLPLPQKKAILHAIYPKDPVLVTLYLRLLFSNRNAWGWGGQGAGYIGRIDAKTGYYQEALPFVEGWPPRRMEITDLDNVKEVNNI